MEVQNLSPQGIGFVHGEEHGEECHGTFVPRTNNFLFLIEPLLCLPQEGEGKQVEPDALRCDVHDDDHVAQLEEVLEMHVLVLTRQIMIVMRLVQSLKFPSTMLIVGPMGTLATTGVE